MWLWPGAVLRGPGGPGGRAAPPRAPGGRRVHRQDVQHPPVGLEGERRGDGRVAGQQLGHRSEAGGGGPLSLPANSTMIVLICNIGIAIILSWWCWYGNVGMVLLW